MESRIVFSHQETTTLPSGNWHAFVADRKSNTFTHDIHRNEFRLALIDERPLRRASISQLLATRAAEFEILSFSGPEELLEHSADHTKLEAIVINIGGATISDPTVCTKLQQLKLGLPGIPLVVLCDRDAELSEPLEIRQILASFRDGVCGYIPTTLSPCIVVAALRLVTAGGTFLPSTLLLNSLDEPPLETGSRSETGTPPPTSEGFTPRQLEVLHYLRQGKANKVIAYELNMQECTVKVHIRQIMKKLKATNRTHAALLASKLCLAEGEVSH